MIEKDKQDKLRTQSFKRIFQSDDGKILMEFLELECNANHSTYKPHLYPDIKTGMAIEEGKRIIHLKIRWYLEERYLREANND